MSQYVLGISAFYHDSATCLIKDGEIFAATQEERFTRIKHDAAFPIQSIKYCLREAGISIGDLAVLVFYDKPFLKFERLLSTYLSYAPSGIRSFLKAMPVWLKEKLFLKDYIQEQLKFEGKILFSEHHESHGASAFFPSPFQKAAILTMDGVGEWATTTFGYGEGNRIHLTHEINFPHSLGLLYSAFTYYGGFRVNSGEYKLMGLAPYGEPKYTQLIKDHLIEIKPDGSFKLNMDYFDYGVGLKMTNDRFHQLFGGPPRRPEGEITQRDMDIARSIQEVTEEVMVKMANYVYWETKQDNLCLAGGVALNCVGNGKILKQCPFKNIWIQPAAGDAGGALGAALMGWYEYLDHPRTIDSRRDFQSGSYLGPDYGQAIEEFVQNHETVFEKIEEKSLAGKVAQLIADQKVIGLFRGRMEFGPRALGNRSIVADPRSEQMQSTLNLKIKFRESFRPFAPSVLEEKVSDFFDLQEKSPYMLLVAPVKEEKRVQTNSVGKTGLDRLKVKRSVIPAVTHVDSSARIQTVSEKTNPFFHQVISAFERLTGVALIINTSFNVRGEPIVCTPEQAYRCFMTTGMDFLVMGPYVFDKTKQPGRERYSQQEIVKVLD